MRAPLLRDRRAMLWMLPPMIVTELSRQAFAYRRFRQRAINDGFEPVSENGDPLWKFHRGAWANRRIVDVRIAPGGQELWIKVEGEIGIAYIAQRQP